ncbi:MAG: acyl--CoA ligase [Syntrophomonadaceae bacterium]|jgi:acyl-CoA synthetase (AMP-forming)/AMP-acid ligase II|nr:acyl--CoA ligase [Syntrophomonadaceae bacterium]
MLRISPQKDVYEYWKLPLINDYVKKWALITPEERALVFCDDGRVYTYAEFDEIITSYTLKLMELGIKKGDVVATQMLAIPEFYILMLACSSMGAICASLDVRLQAHEVVRDLKKVDPVAFFVHGKTPIRNFNQVADAVRDNISSLKYLFQFDRQGQGIAEKSLNFDHFFSAEALMAVDKRQDLLSEAQKVYAAMDKRDPHMIIFTTGTTGDPKPALICHENTITNNAVMLRVGTTYGPNYAVMNCMPTSHVTGTLQGAVGTWHRGGCFITMPVFTPDGLLKNIDKYRPTAMGLVPTGYRMLWAHPDYNKYDLSSLTAVTYGGSAVDKPFLKRMSKMAPTWSTGFGMTECAGYISFTPKGATVDEVFGQVGQTNPDLAKVTIRQPMNADGTAGEELPVGELGEICVDGPLVFLGYYNNPEATAMVKTKEGILYTGDMGYLRDYGNYLGISFSGRRKFVIKPKGYLVFPEEVAFYISTHPKVNQAHVSSAPHEIFVDGVMAFVQPQPGQDLTSEEILEFCKGIASYKRPLHVEIWPPDQPLPLNRVNKVDVQAMNRLAVEIADKLRSEGKWDLC